MKKDVCMTQVRIEEDLYERIKVCLGRNPGEVNITKLVNKFLDDELKIDEREHAKLEWKKLQDSGQYQRIKQLEGDVEKLKEDHTTVKEIMQTVKKGLVELEEDMTKTILEMPKIIEQRVAHSFLEGMNKELNKDGVPERKKESVLKELMGDTRYKQFKKLAKTPSNKKRKHTHRVYKPKKK